MADKDFLEFDLSSKNIIDTDSEDENEKSNAAPVPTSSEMRSMMKRAFNYMEEIQDEESIHLKDGQSLVYADKPQTLDHLKDNIRRVIADIRPQMLEEVIENWTSRLDYIRASRGSPMPDIIFKM
ncbi:hypothetical protein TNCV_1509251 [Trichonephila clavipes]|nr:hypothetical protein TNCV_1509251 [Trichonephila clavipes]